MLKWQGTVIQTLRMQFGRPELIIHTMLQKIRDETVPEADKLGTLVNFPLAVHK